MDSNLGVTVLPRMAFHQYEGTNLVLRPFAEPLIRRTVGLLVKQDRELSQAATKLREIIRTAFAAHS